MGELDLVGTARYSSPMGKIPLSQGNYALVSDEDYGWLSQWNWYYSSRGYAVRKDHRRRVKRGKGHRVLIAMHREILIHRGVLGLGDERHTDHIDGNKLNNLFPNLRAVTPSQNNMNAKPSSNNTTGYAGVTLTKWGYQARVSAYSKRHFLGYYKTAKEAGAAVRAARIVLQGEYAWNCG